MGPKAEGVLVVEVREEEEEVVFVNHTVMWRKRGMEKKGVLEGGVGRWMHGGMVRGLVEGGVRAVMAMK